MKLQQSYSEACVQVLISLHATQARQQQQVLQSPALRYIGHVFTVPDKTWQGEARRGRNGNLVLVVLTRDMLCDMSERCQRLVAPFEAPDWQQLVRQVLITTYKHSCIHHCELAITPSKGAACQLCGLGGKKIIIIHLPSTINNLLIAVCVIMYIVVCHLKRQFCSQ